MPHLTRKFALASFLLAAVVSTSVVGGRWYFKPAVEVSSDPILECPEAVKIGPVEYGAVIEAHFTVANRGGSDLFLDQFRASCACQSLEVREGSKFVRAAEIRLAPGERAELRLVMSINERVNPSMRAPIFFRTNVPTRPEVAVLVDVPVVLSGFVAVPSSVIVGDVPTGSPAIHVVQLYDSRPARRTVTAVRTSDPARVTARFRAADAKESAPDEAGRGVLVGVIEVTVDTRMPAPINCELATTLSDGSTAPDVIRITGRVTAAVECSPAELYLPRATSSGPVYSAVCLVRSTLPSAELALAAVSTPDGVVVEVADHGVGVRRVVISLAKDCPRPELPRNVTVKMRATIGDQKHELEIPVRILPKDTK